MSITFGTGITLGRGITVTPTNNGFTITPSSFSSPGHGGGITPNGTNGFTDTGTNTAGGSIYVFNAAGALASTLDAYWAANGLDKDGSGYVFNVAWGAGSSGSGLALVGYEPYNQVLIGPLDPTGGAYQTQGLDNFSVPAAAGTYNFPATFTLYQPKTKHNNDWC